jgi:hypothetical protein
VVEPPEEGGLAEQAIRQRRWAFRIAVVALILALSVALATSAVSVAVSASLLHKVSKLEASHRADQVELGRLRQQVAGQTSHIGSLEDALRNAGLPIPEAPPGSSSAPEPAPTQQTTTSTTVRHTPTSAVATPPTTPGTTPSPPPDPPPSQPPQPEPTTTSTTSRCIDPPVTLPVQACRSKP